MTRRQTAWRFICLIGVVVVPALPRIWWINSHKIADDADGMTFEQQRQHWERELRDADQSRRDSVAFVYQAALGRITSLESKAIGLFGAASIVAAGAFVACTGATLAAAAGLLALLYIVSALVACGWVTVPRARRPLGLQDVLSATSGIAEMAAATRMLEAPSLRTANFITSAVYDLIRGAAVTTFALLVFVIAAGGKGP